ncbi:MAG TPA: methyltransferase domain-containing protein [Chitinophagaceae bacterium]|nr:methyltransferase domain-containing protein [Chitinophagaceae bacterium]
MPQVKQDDFSKLEYEGWERVANQYEQTWANLTQQFIGPLLQTVGIRNGMKVLDVACGPGYVSGEIKKKNATPVGIDFSPKMISLARRSYQGIQFMEGNAQELEFDDSTYDAVVMNFGMLHLSRPLLAIAEAHRVLKAGGKFGFTVWSPGPVSEIMDKAKEKYADRNVPMPDAPAYDMFAEEKTCLHVLTQAGFESSSIKFMQRIVRWIVPTAGFLFDAELNAGVRNAAFLRQQSVDVLQKIKADVETNMQQFKTVNGFELPFCGCVISARVIK